MKNREEPSVVSTRPAQMQFNYDDITSSEPEIARALEPHGQSCLADTEQPALSEPEPHGNVRSLPEVQQDLMELIVEPENLERAWQQVRSNRGAAGPDGMPIADFPLSLIHISEPTRPY